MYNLHHKLCYTNTYNLIVNMQPFHIPWFANRKFSIKDTYEWSIYGVGFSVYLQESIGIYYIHIRVQYILHVY